MCYSNVKETFRASIHTLCSTGNFKTRLVRAHEILNELSPHHDIPDSLLERFCALQYSVGKNNDSRKEKDVLKTISSMNPMELSVIIDMHISIYEELIRIESLKRT